MCFQQAEDQAYIVKQDEGTVKLDQAYVDGAGLGLDYTDIISPVDGTVVSRNVTGGQTVASSFQDAHSISHRQGSQAARGGHEYQRSRHGRSQGRRQGHFHRRRLSAAGVPRQRDSEASVAADRAEVVTYDVVIGVDNSDLALVPGMTASTTIIIDQRKMCSAYRTKRCDMYRRSLRSKAGAGTPKSRQPQVWVLRDGGPVSVPIVPGLSDDPRGDGR